MTDIFKEIAEMRSLTAIGYKAEDALAAATDPGVRAALQAMLNTNNLDEVWLIAYEQLGDIQKAAEIREWLSRPRRQPDASMLALD